MIGSFGFEQTLVGSLRPLDDQAIEQPLSLQLRALQSRVLPPLSGRIDVLGEIDAGGLADRRPVRGVLHLSRGRLGASDYELAFSANDGRPLRLRARREPRLRQPLWSLSRVVGTLEEEDGRVIARLELRLDYRDAWSRLLKM